MLASQRQMAEAFDSGRSESRQQHIRLARSSDGRSEAHKRNERRKWGRGCLRKHANEKNGEMGSHASVCLVLSNRGVRSLRPTRSPNPSTQRGVGVVSQHAECACSTEYQGVTTEDACN